MFLQTLATLFNTILIFPVVNVLLFFDYVFNLVRVPGAFGLSIVALTIFIRLLLNPLTKQQMLLAKRMEDMKPHLDHLSKKHKDDKKKLQEAQMKLYKEMGVNPATGCLYAIIQIPLVIGLYNVLQLFLQNGNVAQVAATVNKMVYFSFLKISSIDPWFLGFNLGVAPSHFSKYGVYYLAVPVITGILQYYQVKAMSPAKKPEVVVKNKEKDKKAEPDMQTMMGTQMQFMFPLMLGYLSYTLPVGLSLYWNIFSIFSILQYQKKPAVKNKN